MLKHADSLKEVEARALKAVDALLADVPFVQDVSFETNVSMRREIDILAEVTIKERKHRLVCEVKGNGQPRFVRAGILHVRSAAAQFDPPATPIFIAPYLSPEAQALCLEEGVGYLDLVGNARIVFGTVYIERQFDAKPPAVQRGLKSVFKPKSAQILRTLLRDPDQAWRVVDLADASDVSLGLVSNVRSELVDREWAEINHDGIRLVRPDALLDAWRDVYEAPAGERSTYYTTLHGKAFEDAARNAMNFDPARRRAACASFSAANWLAPYGRVSTQYFYADTSAAARLRTTLKLSPADSGANVVITIPKEQGIFRDTVDCAQGIVCTSPVQTYLDLSVAGERGAEAADHLRKELLAWR
ncbi:hypothetical protein J2Y48_005055 [Mycoplana sp. BE70]|uniref:type IV toxin-antitoxin system AbiEi family antitoxin n=1 Tax=Mycoplana sp. BE70 TaxID=2817775 RepID=UPI00285A488E|nr:type IV toxin-antitoxin system AbiEi family antitoxin [Mycoplana sp. BE70]MDR6759737.1 hypothetical protein [Mycoplana sp. BE70]